MPKITLKDYNDLIKKERIASFDKPYDLAYNAFEKLGYFLHDEEFFKKNASTIVENVRKECWDLYVPEEKKFCAKMLKKLIDKDIVADMSPVQAIEWFATEYPEHIYSLNLSNTQSRRSRAGKEFEAIIELILVGANIRYDSQGNVGKSTFVDKGLGKLVDVVVPSAQEFNINKFSTVLISAKTTLRERWQEVPEEMGRTGARDMYLVTLDDSVTDEVITALYEANIQLVTTKSIKDDNYAKKPSVVDFETLIDKCSKVDASWSTYTYSESELADLRKMIKKEKKKRENHPFVIKYLNKKEKKL